MYDTLMISSQVLCKEYCLTVVLVGQLGLTRNPLSCSCASRYNVCHYELRLTIVIASKSYVSYRRINGISLENTKLKFEYAKLVYFIWIGEFHLHSIVNTKMFPILEPWKLLQTKLISNLIGCDVARMVLF